jgi:hypothetical protein
LIRVAGGATQELALDDEGQLDVDLGQAADVEVCLPDQPDATLSNDAESTGI